MIPFFFGSKERRLFGVYDPAAPAPGVAKGVVLCNSWGREYVNAHRAVRFAAKRLREAGFHTLRFDFFGSGDSGGDTQSAELGGWRDDIETAIEELRISMGGERIVLFGLRLGANLAADVAIRRPEGLDALVLFDPILSGDLYLAEFRTARVPGGEFGGMLVGDAFILGLGAIDFGPAVKDIKVATLIALTAHAGPLRSEWLSLANGAKGRVSFEFSESTPPWLEDSKRPGALPVNVMDRIVQWLR